MSDFSIFLSESFMLNKITIIVLTLFTLIIAAVELKFQKTDLSFTLILRYDFGYILSLWVMLFIAEFLFAWKSHYLGGEQAAAVILLCIIGIASTFIKYRINQAAGIHFSNEWLFVLLPVLLILIPVVFFVAFIFALGSSWSI